jgi:site-specific recombinase XerD
MESITLAMLQEYRIFLNSKKMGLSIPTQNYHLTALREFLRFANQNMWSKIDPKVITLHSLPKKSTPVHPQVDLTTLQVKHTTPSPEGFRDKLILELLVSTGLKVSELVSLTRADVFPNFRQLNIGQGASRRTMLLPASASLALERYLKSRQDDYSPLLIRHKGMKHGDIPSLTTRTIQRTIKRLSKSQGLDTITPTTIRNQFASNLFSEGVNISHASQILGHTHQSSTSHIKSTLSKRDI